MKKNILKVVGIFFVMAIMFSLFGTALAGTYRPNTPSFDYGMKSGGSLGNLETDNGLYYSTVFEECGFDHFSGTMPTYLNNMKAGIGSINSGSLGDTYHRDNSYVNMSIAYDCPYFKARLTGNVTIGDTTGDPDITVNSRLKATTWGSYVYWLGVDIFNFTSGTWKELFLQSYSTSSWINISETIDWSDDYYDNGNVTISAHTIHQLSAGQLFYVDQLSGEYQRQKYLYKMEVDFPFAGLPSGNHDFYLQIDNLSTNGHTVTYEVIDVYNDETLTSGSKSGSLTYHHGYLDGTPSSRTIRIELSCTAYKNITGGITHIDQLCIEAS